MTRPSARWVRTGLAIGGVAALGATYALYRQDMRAITERMSAESRVVQTRHGPVEFAAVGTGLPMLVAHGAGGGYDQGLSIARAFSGEGFRWIAPSRFGYLRTPLPIEASTVAQADAFAALLDELGVDRVAILAMSGGVPPALQFALRYPARISALVLLSSAPYTPLTAAQQQLPIPSWLYEAIFSSDFPYWALTKVARSSLETIFDVKPAVLAKLTPAERGSSRAPLMRLRPLRRERMAYGMRGRRLTRELTTRWSESLCQRSSFTLATTASIPSPSASTPRGTSPGPNSWHWIVVGICSWVIIRKSGSGSGRSCGTSDRARAGRNH